MLFVVWGFRHKLVRESFLGVLKAFFVKSIIIIIVIKQGIKIYNRTQASLSIYCYRDRSGVKSNGSYALNRVDLALLTNGLKGSIPDLYSLNRNSRFQY